MIRGSESMASALAIPRHELIGDVGIRRVNGMECAHLTRKDLPGTDGGAGLAALGCSRWEKPRTIEVQVRAATLTLRGLQRESKREIVAAVSDRRRGGGQRPRTGIDRRSTLQCGLRPPAS